jgi:signal transduction histidine kinase
VGGTRRPGASRGARRIAGALAATLITAYLVAPAESVTRAIVEIGMQSAVAPLVLWGVRRHRPAHPAGWYVLAAAHVPFTAGLVLAVLLPAIGGYERVGASWADAAFLTSYVGVVTAIVLLLRAGSPGSWTTAVLDSATVWLGFTSVWWALVLHPLLIDPTTTTAAGVTIALYALLDMSLVALVVHVVARSGFRTPAAGWLTVAVIGLVTSDFAQGLGLHGGVLDVGWLLFYVGLAAAATHPSMRHLAEPATEIDGQRAFVRRLRVPVLAASALLPATLIAVDPRSDTIGILAIISLATVACVLWRMLHSSASLREEARARELRDEMLSVVSHELRTPLTSILGTMQALQRGVGGSLTGRQEQLVGMAATNSARLARLVDDLLDVQRLSSGVPVLYLGPVRVQDVVEDVIEQLAPLADEAEVRLEQRRSSAVVLADRDRLQQIVLNLLGNAIKFSPPGTACLVSSQRRGDEVLVRVKDQGSGIPAGAHERIFQPFRQADSSDRRAHDGTGLGLAIVRALVEQHGGRAWAESNAGRGATFLFTLPAAPADALGQPPSPPPPPGPSDADPGPPPGPAAGATSSPAVPHGRSRARSAGR